MIIVKIIPGKFKLEGF